MTQRHTRGVDGEIEAVGSIVQATYGHQMGGFCRVVRQSRGVPWVVSCTVFAAALAAVLVLIVPGVSAAGGPTIQVLSPANGSTLSGGTITISGTATNATRVQVCIDATNCQEASGVSSWSASFSTSSLSAGTHTIKACAFDAVGAQACATIILTVTVSLMQTYQSVDTLLEVYVAPVLTVAGVAVAIVVALVPKSFRVGRGLAQSLALVAIASLVLRVLTGSPALPYLLSSALLAAALVVDRIWRPASMGGMA